MVDFITSHDTNERVLAKIAHSQSRKITLKKTFGQYIQILVPLPKDNPMIVEHKVNGALRSQGITTISENSVSAAAQPDSLPLTMTLDDYERLQKRVSDSLSRGFRNGN